MTVVAPVPPEDTGNTRGEDESLPFTNMGDLGGSIGIGPPLPETPPKKRKITELAQTPEKESITVEQFGHWLDRGKTELGNLQTQLDALGYPHEQFGISEFDNKLVSVKTVRHTEDPLFKARGDINTILIFVRLMDHVKTMWDEKLSQQPPQSNQKLQNYIEVITPPVEFTQKIGRFCFDLATLFHHLVSPTITGGDNILADDDTVEYELTMPQYQGMNDVKIKISVGAALQLVKHFWVLSQIFSPNGRYQGKKYKGMRDLLKLKLFRGTERNALDTMGQGHIVPEGFSTAPSPYNRDSMTAALGGGGVSAPLLAGLPADVSLASINTTS